MGFYPDAVRPAQAAGAKSAVRNRGHHARLAIAFALRPTGLLRDSAVILYRVFLPSPYDGDQQPPRADRGEPMLRRPPARHRPAGSFVSTCGVSASNGADLSVRPPITLALAPSRYASGRSSLRASCRFSARSAALPARSTAKLSSDMALAISPRCRLSTFARVLPGRHYTSLRRNRSPQGPGFRRPSYRYARAPRRGAPDGTNLLCR
jgi:hypothetical protein